MRFAISDLKQVTREPRSDCGFPRRFRQTNVKKRTLLAGRFEHGCRHLPLFNEPVQLGNGILSQLPQFLRKLDFAAALAGGVKDSTPVNHNAEHFFQAKRLGAELGVVVVELAAFAFFVFNRDQSIVAADVRRL